jgi:Uma2 family endonuclease
MSVDQNTNKLTYEYYACIPNDGKRHEIIDGEHYVNPAPNLTHQTLSRRIQFQLYTQIELANRGVVFNAPVDVQLSEFDIVQPDLVVVLARNKGILTDPKIDGVPDLVIEILSPTNPQHDRNLKKQLYLRGGVPEYWIVDPMNEAIEQYVLSEGKYVRQAACEPIPLKVIENVSVTTLDLWKA